MEKKGLPTAYIILITVIIICATILIIVLVQNSDKISSASNSQNQKQVIIERDIMFSASWRSTTSNCNRIVLNTNNDKLGEVAYSFSISKSNNENCKIYIDNKDSGVTFSGSTSIASTNSYAGQYDATQQHSVKVCCGEVCKTSTLSPLCNKAYSTIQYPSVNRVDDYSFQVNCLNYVKSELNKQPMQRDNLALRNVNSNLDYEYCLVKEVYTLESSSGLYAQGNRYLITCDCYYFY